MFLNNCHDMHTLSHFWQKTYLFSMAGVGKLYMAYSFPICCNKNQKLPHRNHDIPVYLNEIFFAYPLKFVTAKFISFNLPQKLKLSEIICRCQF